MSKAEMDEMKEKMVQIRTLMQKTIATKPSDEVYSEIIAALNAGRESNSALIDRVQARAEELQMSAESLALEASLLAASFETVTETMEMARSMHTELEKLLFETYTAKTGLVVTDSVEIIMNHINGIRSSDDLKPTPKVRKGRKTKQKARK